MGGAYCCAPIFCHTPAVAPRHTVSIKNNSKLGYETDIDSRGTKRTVPFVPLPLCP